MPRMIKPESLSLGVPGHESTAGGRRAWAPRYELPGRAGLGVPTMPGLSRAPGGESCHVEATAVINKQGQESRGSGLETCSGVWSHNTPRRPSPEVVVSRWPLTCAYDHRVMINTLIHLK